MLYLSRVRLVNVRCFEQLDIKFPGTDDPPGWTVFVGDNATGKSALLRSIAHDIVLRARRRLVWSRPSFLERGPGFPRRPQKVFFSLYRADGCLRWLGQAGWASQNLVLIGEYGASSDSDAAFVKNAEVVLGGIRLRSRIDAAEASEAIDNLTELVHDLLNKAARRRRRGTGRQIRA